MKDPFENDEPTASLRVLPMANALLRWRLSVLVIMVLSGTISTAWAFLSPQIWTCSTSFLPSGGVAATGRMGALLGNGSAELSRDGAGPESSSEYYADLLRSNAFLQSIVAQPFMVDGHPELLAERWGIVESSDQTRLQRTAEVLKRNMQVIVAKAIIGSTSPRLITVEVRADGRQLSADIAARILARVEQHNVNVRGERSKRNLEFVRSRWSEAQQELRLATDRFADFSSRNRRLATPGLIVEKDRLEREVRVKEEVFLTLTRQVELARIEEQERRITLEVIQPPEPPLERSSPGRTRMVLAGLMVGFLLACAWVAVGEWRLRLFKSEDPDAIEFRNQLSSLSRLTLWFRAKVTSG